MSAFTVIWPRSRFVKDSAMDELMSHPLVDRMIVICPQPAVSSDPKVQVTLGERPLSGDQVMRALTAARTPYVLCIAPDAEFEFGPRTLERFAEVLDASRATWVYSDYRERRDGAVAVHPTIDYQLGSVRDAFDFGPIVGISRRAALAALDKHGPLANQPWTGMYELRLKMSVDRLPFRIPEYLYTIHHPDVRPTGEKQLDYVDPRNEDLQRDCELVCSNYLRTIGAFLEPRFRPVPTPTTTFPVTASVIIPVRNRVKTVADAIGSVLEQKTDFPFNIIIVDNHSSDGTSHILAELSAKHANVHAMTPERTDLGIGGCWNHAVMSKHCGRYAVQLDSDDLYSGTSVLQQIVDTLQDGPYALVVGSYRLVDMNLEELPPGVIDHREWSHDNGRNNLLRVNGMGAPRAFDTNIFRANPMPNVSYGEDYCVVMRFSREYEVGRIYDPIYLCRRWEGNTDAALPIDIANTYDTYKDRLRTLETLARQQMNEKGHVG